MLSGYLDSSIESSFETFDSLSASNSRSVRSAESASSAACAGTDMAVRRTIRMKNPGAPMQSPRAYSKHIRYQPKCLKRGAFGTGQKALGGRMLQVLKKGQRFRRAVLYTKNTVTSRTAPPVYCASKGALISRW